MPRLLDGGDDHLKDFSLPVCKVSHFKAFLCRTIGVRGVCGTVGSSGPSRSAGPSGPDGLSEPSGPPCPSRPIGVRGDIRAIRGHEAIGAPSGP